MATDRSVLLDAGGRPLRRPVVYLDHSTLVDAFEGKRGAAGPNAAINAELAAIVEDVASRGALCLSFIHVIELVQRPRLNDAVAMASWLEALGPLWFQTYGADDDELANEVRRRLGLNCTWPSRLPIHYGLTPAVQAGFKTPALADAERRILDLDLPSLVRTIHGHPALGDTFEYLRARSVNLLTNIHANRSSIPEGTPQHAAAVRGVEARVRKHVEDAGCRLIAGAPVERGESYPNTDEVRRAVWKALDDPDAIPLTKIGLLLSGNVSDGITGQTPTSGRFRHRFQAFNWDSRHALAAAVVDVFTCDAFTHGAMGDFRTSRGMNPQISMRDRQSNDRASLVADLRRQCAPSTIPGALGR